MNDHFNQQTNQQTNHQPDDRFLHHHRKAPDQAFVDDLYRQLLAEDEMSLPMTRTFTQPPALPLSISVSPRIVTAAAALVLIFVAVALGLRLNPDPTPATLVQIDTSFMEQLQPITTENAGELVEIMQLGNGSIYDVDWQGEVIAVGGTLGVWIFDATDLDAEPRLLRGSTLIYDRQIALAGEVVAATDGDRIRVWNIVSGEEVGVYGEDGLGFSALDLSADGRYLIGSQLLSVDPQRQFYIRIWDRETDEITFTTVEREPVVNLALNPVRPQEFAVQNTFGTCLWQDEGNDGTALLNCYEGRSASGGIYPRGGLVYTPDGAMLAFSTASGVSLWDSTTREITGEIRPQDTLQAEPLQAEVEPFIVALAFSADGGYLALSSLNFGSHVWSMADQAFVEALANTDPLQRATSLTFKDRIDDPVLVTVAAGSELHFTALNRDSAPAPVQGFTGPMLAGDLNADGRTLATIGPEGYIQLWDLQTGDISRTIATAQFNYALSFSPDGTVLAYSGFDPFDPTTPQLPLRGNIRILDVATGEPRREVTDSEVAYVLLAFSPDGQTLVAHDPASEQITRWDWQAETDEAGIRPLIDVGTYVEGLSYTPDGSQIVILNTGQPLRFFDAATGSVQPPLNDAPGQVSTFAYSPDGTRLAVSEIVTGVLSYTRIYDATTGVELARLSYTPNTDLVNGLTFSPDGTLIAGLIDGDHLHVWDATTGERLFEVDQVSTGSTSLVFRDGSWGGNHLEFTSDGRMLVTTDYGGLIHVWAIPE